MHRDDKGLNSQEEEFQYICHTLTGYSDEEFQQTENNGFAIVTTPVYFKSKVEKYWIEGIDESISSN